MTVRVQRILVVVVLTVALCASLAAYIWSLTRSPQTARARLT
jgi:hypothetical protein